MTVAPFREDPFWSKIVNVNWGGANNVLGLFMNFQQTASSSSGPPSLLMPFKLKMTGVFDVDAFAGTLAVARPGAVGPAPPITSVITPAMLAYYMVWSYPLISIDSSVSHSHSDAYYFIFRDDGGGVFPDFVASPYSSVAAAEAYLDNQLIIHPSYAGAHFVIAFQPASDNYTQTKTRKAAAFLNLNALPKDNFGNVNIALDCIITGDGDASGPTSILAAMWQGSSIEVDVDANNQLLSFNPFPSAFDSTNQSVDSHGLLGQIVAHPDAPATLTIPHFGGGGGGG